MRHMTALTAISLFIGLGLLTGPVEAKTVNVNCNMGQTIAKALAKAKPVKPLIVNIEGVCSENVTVERDDVTLQGHVTGGTVSGTISFVGANRGTVKFLTVTGPGDGILVGDGASVMITNSEIENNEACGIAVARGSFARIEMNIVTGNGESEECAGLDVGSGASVFTRANEFTDNFSAAISVGANGYLQNGSGTPPDEDMDIIVQKGCTKISADPATCGYDETLAVEVYRNGNVNFRKACIIGFIDAYDLSLLTAFHSNIAGKIRLRRNSVMRSRKGNIEGNIEAETGSGVVRQGALSIDGTLFCDSTAFADGLACGDTFSDAVPPAATRCDDLFPFSPPD